MPSNHIYEITEDTNGFLWIGTDNGVSRFDGKRFVNYTTKDGLPSNDVIQIVKEKNGTIWANCYKQAPCYFDEKNNKFVSFENDSNGGLIIDMRLAGQNGTASSTESGALPPCLPLPRCSPRPSLPVTPCRTAWSWRR